jgi:hypothetical protein
VARGSKEGTEEIKHLIYKPDPPAVGLQMERIFTSITPRYEFEEGLRPWGRR